MIRPPIGIKIGSNGSMPEKCPNAIHAKPVISTRIGIIRRCCLRYAELKLQIPTSNEMAIMVISTSSLARKPIPHIGKTVIKNGNAAQCMAQSVEAVMPILSRLILELRCFIKINLVHKYKSNLVALK